MLVHTQATRSTSPRVRGEVDARSASGEGGAPRAETSEPAPHPHPLPASSGEREPTEREAFLLSFPRKREPITTGLWNMGPRFRGDDRNEIRSPSEPQRNAISK